MMVSVHDARVLRTISARISGYFSQHAWTFSASARLLPVPAGPACNTSWSRQRSRVHDEPWGLYGRCSGLTKEVLPQHALFQFRPASFAHLVSAQRPVPAAWL